MKHYALAPLNIEKFQENLTDWYESEHRDLPWRKDRDPYKIWVSEVMLQQTRVDTVIPYFERFINRFPTVEALAEADEETVLKSWEGLGYYLRARNLQEGVREVHEKYEAKVPDNKKEISGLKGVGPYTAGAILSIAYGKAEPAVDGNVMRVMSRVLMVEDDIAKPKTRKLFEATVAELIPEGRTSEFNQGLMELGAVVCTPKSPKCLLCPVQEHCRAFAEGRQDELPKKGKKKPPKVVPMAVAVLKNGDGKVLIHRRPQQGLLAGLWEFPGFEVSRDGNKKEQLTQQMKETYGIEADLDKRLRNIQHVFTHLKWELAVYEGIVKQPISEQDNLKFVSVDELKAYPFPVSHQKIIAMIHEGTEEQ
ncbi:MAG TPA: A/G-specific adenine glycosylase [Bacillales bacterium]